MTDPIADMLTRIRNATIARHTRVDIPASTLKLEIAKILELEGYIQSFKTVETPDGDGNLLDHSLIVYGSGMSNGNIHDHENLPTLVVGGGAGKLAGDRHLRMKTSTPLSNLWITVLDKAGIPTDKFGESVGRIEL